MPSIKFRGYKYYYEVDGNGPPLILIHPFMSSIFHWHKSGWTNLLKKNNTLIMFDYPGHGKSSSPVEINHYYVGNATEILIKILEELKIDTFVAYGFSMGGRICFDLLKKYSDRVLGLIVGGMHAKPPSTHKKIISHDDENLNPKVMQKFDVSALKFCSKAQDEWNGAESAILDFQKPALLFTGTQDPYYNWIKSTSKLFSKIEFFEYDGLGHIGAFWRLNRVSESVESFLRKINSS